MLLSVLNSLVYWAETMRPLSLLAFASMKRGGAILVARMAKFKSGPTPARQSNASRHTPLVSQALKLLKENSFLEEKTNVFAS